MKFVNLADASDEEILRYARQRGVLGICEHDLPAGHSPKESAHPCDPRWLPDREGPRYWEATNAWRRFAREAKAILNVATKAYQGEARNPEDWQIIFSGHPWTTSVMEAAGVLNTEGFDSPTMGSVILGMVVESWLAWGDVRPIFHFNIYLRRSTVEFGGDGLFGALALQLLMTVARESGIALCSSCGQWFTPHRRPSASSLRRHYCTTCGRTAAVRQAVRDLRQRTKPSLN